MTISILSSTHTNTTARTMEPQGSSTASKRKRDDNDEGRHRAKKEKKAERRAAKRASEKTSGISSNVVEEQLDVANGTEARENLSETGKAQDRAEKKAWRAEQKRAAARQAKDEAAGTVSAAMNGGSSMAETAAVDGTLPSQGLNQHQAQQKPKKQRTTATDMWMDPAGQEEMTPAHIDKVNHEVADARKRDSKTSKEDLKEQRQKKKDEQKEKIPKREKRNVQRELLAIPQDDIVKPNALSTQAIGTSVQTTAPTTTTTEIAAKRKSTASRRKERNATEGKEVEYKSRKPEGRSAPWTISKTIGGRYIDANPCFTPDEQ